jgi:hypothetical protein
MFLSSTPYYVDSELYQELVEHLVQRGAQIFALLNVETLENDFFTECPRIVPILLTSCRKFEVINAEERDINQVTFDKGRERRLLDILPNVDYVINFAGPEFVEVFTEQKRRPKYR